MSRKQRCIFGQWRRSTVLYAPLCSRFTPTRGTTTYLP